MLALIMRHYRRFTTFCVGMSMMSVVLTSTLFQITTHLTLAGLFVAFSLVYFLGAVALYFVRPHRRSLLEVMGFCAGITTIAMLYLDNNSGAQVLTWLLLFAALTLAVWHFLHSNMARRIGQNTVWKDRYAAQVPFPARLIWKHVVPGASDPQDHCTGIMDHFEQDPEDPTTVHVTFKGRSSRRAEYALTFLEDSKPNICRFFFQGQEADGTFVDGIFAIRITHLDSTTSFLACNEERRGLPLAAQMERWFDDAMGFQHDRLLAILHERYADGQGITKPMRPTA